MLFCVDSRLEHCMLGVEQLRPDFGRFFYLWRVRRGDA